jgi:hypothetical protein
MRAQTALALCFMACSCQGSSSGGGTDAGGDAVTDAVIDAVSDAATDAASDAAIDAASDATADAPQDPDADAGSTECNDLSNVGAVVRQVYVAARPVTGDGGVIAAGTYVLTAAVVYTGPDGGVGETGTTFADTLALSSGGTYERVFSVVNDAGLDGTPMHQNGMFTTDGGGVQVIQTCPTGRQPFTSYDADGTTLRIYAPAGALGPGVMFEYTRR